MIFSVMWNNAERVYMTQHQLNYRLRSSHVRSPPGDQGVKTQTVEDIYTKNTNIARR